MDEVAADTRHILGVLNWITAARKPRNRDDWRKLLVEARARQGVVAPSEWKSKTVM
ncbi:unnamed protein product [Nezara viridula]|uniref:Uncharacterized protein n=1 Tax=Nezara viridula TaxID=85310 RepID=A0A9P0E9T7_NEZVI|nr:unnamed protein product [Nezara viridula]